MGRDPTDADQRRRLGETDSPPPPVSQPFDIQSEEMGGAGNARVVVANGLLTLGPHLLGGEMEKSRDEAPEIVFHAGLILRSGRDDFRPFDQSVLIDVVAVKKNAARGLGEQEPEPTLISGSRWGRSGR